MRLGGSLLEMEAAILEASNAVGRCVTEGAPKRFDTDGSPMRVGEIKLTARGRDPKEHQTRTGRCRSSATSTSTCAAGASTACSSTRRGSCAGPHGALLVNSAASTRSSTDVRCKRTSSRTTVGPSPPPTFRTLPSGWAASPWPRKRAGSAMPALKAPIATVVASLDGAMIPMADAAGYREAMVGALSFYGHEGERQHNIYLAAAPEYGKQAFLQRLEREILRAKQHFPAALYLGIAGGAASNLRFLEQHTDRQLIDFFHDTEYLGKLAQASYPRRQAASQRAQWQHEHCQKLKHDPDAIDALIDEAARLSQRHSLSQKVRVGAISAWTYFTTTATRWTIPASSPPACQSARASPRRPVRHSSSSACARPGCAGRPKAPQSCSTCAPSPKLPDAEHRFGRGSISSALNAVEHIIRRPHPTGLPSVPKILVGFPADRHIGCSMQILILGMHRSGTSTLTRLVNMMGAYFGPEASSTGANVENPKGFWERKDIRELNDQLLFSVGKDWNAIADYDPLAVPEEKRHSFERAARSIILSLDAHRPWVTKEPRLCVNLPLWLPLLECPVCLISLRNPLEIARSLLLRNNIPITVGLSLTQIYYLRMLRASQTLPRVLVRYEELVRNPISEVERICAALSQFGVKRLTCPAEREILAFVDPQLRRHRSDPAQDVMFLTKSQSDFFNALLSGHWEQLEKLSDEPSEALALLGLYEGYLERALLDQRRRDDASIAQEIAALIDRTQLSIRAARASILFQIHVAALRALRVLTPKRVSGAPPLADADRNLAEIRRLLATIRSSPHHPGAQNSPTNSQSREKQKGPASPPAEQQRHLTRR